MIKISNLSFSYGGELVLEQVSLHYHSSDFLGIIGHNGGGKSTLLKLILKLLPQPHSAIQCQSSKIGYVPQHITHNPHFPIPVFDLVLMGRTRPFGLYSVQDKELANQALNKLGIKDLASLPFESLSGGQKQKVLLARALCRDCELLILDEPTASIDPQSTQEIFELLQGLHQEGMGIIVVSHDLDLLLRYATQIAYIQKRLQLFDLPQDLEKLLERFACKHHLKGNCDA